MNSITLIVAELIEAREALGLSQRATAHAMGIDQSQLGKWESGRWHPSSPNLCRWADFFGYDLLMRRREEA